MEGLKRFTVWFRDLNRGEVRQERLHAFHFGEGEWSGGKKGHGTILCTSPKAVESPKEVRWLWEERRRMEGTLAMAILF
jgi:hypothetical protein